MPRPGESWSRVESKSKTVIARQAGTRDGPAAASGAQQPLARAGEGPGRGRRRRRRRGGGGLSVPQSRRYSSPRLRGMRRNPPRKGARRGWGGVGADGRETGTALPFGNGWRRSAEARRRSPAFLLLPPAPKNTGEGQGGRLGSGGRVKLLWQWPVPGCGLACASKALGLIAACAYCWVACPSLKPSTEKAFHVAFYFSLLNGWEARVGGGGREGEINPQLYDNEVLPPLCQRPARKAADLSGVDHLGSSGEPPFGLAALPKGLFLQP